MVNFSFYRRVAQLGSALGLGPRGCVFKSRLSDHFVGVAQLVESLPSKQAVAGSSPVSHSIGVWCNWLA